MFVVLQLYVRYSSPIIDKSKFVCACHMVGTKKMHEQVSKCPMANKSSCSLYVSLVCKNVHFLQRLLVMISCSSFQCIVIQQFYLCTSFVHLIHIQERAKTTSSTTSSPTVIPQTPSTPSTSSRKSSDEQETASISSSCSLSSAGTPAGTPLLFHSHTCTDIRVPPTF